MIHDSKRTRHPMVESIRMPTASRILALVCLFYVSRSSESSLRINERQWRNTLSDDRTSARMRRLPEQDVRTDESEVIDVSDENVVNDTAENAVNGTSEIDEIVAIDSTNNDTTADVDPAPQIVSNQRIDPANSDLSTEPVRSRIRTTFEAVSGSYGNMFDVRGLKEIFINGLDFHTDLLTNVTYEVYTKRGSYLSAKNDLSAWTMVGNGTSLGRGLGAATPVEGMDPIHVKEGQTVGIYVTLTTYDIRYSKGTAVGHTYVENNEIQILEGSGVANYPLGELFYAPRVWNGQLHYTFEPTSAPTSAPTASFPPTAYEAVLTTVEFPFKIQIPHNTSVSEVEKEIDGTVTETFSSIISADTEELKILAESYKLNIDSVMSIVSDAEGGSDCTANNGYQCSSVNIRVNVSHNPKITSDEIGCSLHKYSQALNEGVDLLMDYMGPKVADTGMVFSLEVAKTDEHVTLGESSQHSFENIAKKMLYDDLSKSENPIKIISVKIDLEDATKTRRLLDTSDMLDIHATITGEYTPPPEVNLGAVVEESMTNQVDTFVTELNESPDFEMEVLEVKARSIAPKPKTDVVKDEVIAQESPAPPVPQEDVSFVRTNGFIALVSISGIAIFGVLFFAAFRVVKKQSKQRNLGSRQTLFKQDMFTD